MKRLCKTNAFSRRDLVVASPVEDYFIHIDELPVEEKVSAFFYSNGFRSKLDSFQSG
jgi:hypothetical protein